MSSPVSEHKDQRQMSQWQKKNLVLFILAYKVYFCLSYLYLSLSETNSMLKTRKFLQTPFPLFISAASAWAAHSCTQTSTSTSFSHLLRSLWMWMSPAITSISLRYAKWGKLLHKVQRKCWKFWEMVKKINLDWRQQIMKDPSAAAWAEMSGMKSSPQKVPKSCAYMGERIFIVPE